MSKRPPSKYGLLGPALPEEGHDGGDQLPGELHSSALNFGLSDLGAHKVDWTEYEQGLINQMSPELQAVAEDAKPKLLKWGDSRCELYLTGLLVGEVPHLYRQYWQRVDASAKAVKATEDKVTERREQIRIAYKEKFQRTKPKSRSDAAARLHEYGNDLHLDLGAESTIRRYLRKMNLP